MRIGVFGTGMVGKAISVKLADLGHEVKLGTRDVESTLGKPGNERAGEPPFSEWLAAHSGITLTTFEQAASGSDFLVNATGGEVSLRVLKMAGPDNLKGKILLDISNPLDFSNGFPPTLSVINDDSLAEQIQRAYPETRVVKSLNTVTAPLMVNPNLLEGDHSIFMNGNDDSAKEEVSSLLQSFGWKQSNIIDLGDITTARGTEQYLSLWTRMYPAFESPYFNVNIVRKVS